MDKGDLIGTIIAGVGEAAERHGLVRPGDSRWDPETNTLHIDGGGVEQGEGEGEGERAGGEEADAAGGKRRPHLTGGLRRVYEEPYSGHREVDEWGVVREFPGGEAIGMERPPRQLVTGGDPDATFRMPGQDRFRDAGGRLDDFIIAPELREIGDALIGRWDELGHCEELRIAYLWRRKKQAKAGKIVLGTCTKLSGKLRAFLKADWEICLNAENCRESRLICYAVEALVYHELSHIGPPDDEDEPDAEPVIVGHDVEMFHAEVRRYGYWKADLAATAEVFEQLRLAL